MSNINVNEKVRVVNPTGPLIKGGIFTVSKVEFPLFSVKELPSWKFDMRRVEPLSKATVNSSACMVAQAIRQNQPTAQSINVKFARDSRGRFTSAVKTVVKQPKVTVSKPASLKKGSLYKVRRKRGFVVARLRSDKPVEGKLIFSTHKHPFLIDETKVFLASKEDVNSYLSEVNK